MLKGNSNIPTDNSSIQILNIVGRSWSIPTQLTSGNTQLTGIWVEIKSTDNKDSLVFQNILSDSFLSGRSTITII